MIKGLRPLAGMMFVVCALMLSVGASMGMAQEAAKSAAKLERERVGRIMEAGANVEEFRREYLNFLTELQEDMRLLNAVPAVQQRYSRAGLRSISMLTAAKNSVSAMPAEDLAKVRAAYAQFPGWREMPQALIGGNLRQALQANLKAKIEGSAPVAINAATIDDCAPALASDISNTDISIAQAASLAAHAAADIVPPVLNAPAVAAYVTTDAVVIGLQTSKAIKDDCQDTTFQETLLGKIDTIPNLISSSTATTAGNITNAQTAIVNNDNANKTTIVNNDNANKTTIVNNDNANATTILARIEAAKTYIVTDARANKDEVKNLLLRTQIEADLASTDGSVFVALYETPGSVCKTSLNDKGLPQTVQLPGDPSPVAVPQCGLLELVRAIVRDTIASVGAGTNAQKFYATAEAQYAAGRYKDAYTSYRQAYKAASK